MRAIPRTLCPIMRQIMPRIIPIAMPQILMFAGKKADDHDGFATSIMAELEKTWMGKSQR